MDKDMDSLPLNDKRAMISVLIPVYKLNFTALVESLLEQFSSNSVPFEILVGDDSPDSVENQLPANWDQQPIAYFHHSPALSRSGNRNFLAQKAKYEYLLFLDGDAIIDNPDFIKNYVKHLEPQKVICGGTSYQSNPPEKKEQFLRWIYGRNREEHSASIRNKRPYQSFSSFNFVIPGSVFREIRFDTAIQEYGHEDTLFGYALKERQVSVEHVDNSLIHSGLDDAADYLEKSEKAIQGLVELSKRKDLPDGFLAENRLWRSSVKIHHYQMHRFLKLLFPFLKPLIMISLKSRKPSIFLFDLYKIAFLSKIQG